MLHLTASELDNWLASGLDRLLLQLWPACVVVYWLTVAPPDARAGDG